MLIFYLFIYNQNQEIHNCLLFVIFVKSSLVCWKLELGVVEMIGVSVHITEFLNILEILGI